MNMADAFRNLFNRFLCFALVSPEHFHNHSIPITHTPNYFYLDLLFYFLNVGFIERGQFRVSQTHISEQSFA